MKAARPLLLLLAASACTDPVSRGEGAEALVTEIMVTPSVLGPTDAATVTLVVTNPTSQTVSFSSSCTGPVFRVYRGSERVDASFCAIPEASPVRIAPGHSVISETRFPVQQYAGGGSYAPLPPGDYQFRGGWEVQGDLLAISPPVSVTITD